ncbi:C-type lectin domain family 4 member K-like [Lithobates pipiens]
MRRPEDLEMKSGQSFDDNVYANVGDYDIQRMKNTPKAKEIPPAQSTKYGVILILGILLILAFIAAVIIMSLLFISYKSINEEIRHMKNEDSGLTQDVSDLQKSVTNITDDLNKIQVILTKVANIMDDLNKIKLIINKANIQDSCTSCPSGWRLIKSNCYYFQPNGETWEKSREECEKRNGIMLILKDKAELDSLLPTIGSGRYWLGLKRDRENINNWLWADGSSLSFSPWNTGEPNNDKGREHCAEILGGLQSMNDRNCEDKIGYICEKAWIC